MADNSMVENITKRMGQVFHVFQPRIKKKIFYLHLPKCGGTSIQHSIKNHYHASEVYHLNNQSCVKSADLLGRDLDDYRRDLLLYYLLHKNIKYVTGHFAYSKTAFDECGGEWNFMTLLRHPVDRWFSHYFYNKFHKNSHFRIVEDLPTFVESDRAWRIGCMYVRNFAEGIDWSDRDNIDMKKAVDGAKKALDNFSLIGCLEHLDVMKQEFKNMFGVRLIIPQSNKNPIQKEQQHQEVSDEIRSRVEEICKPDIEVYEYALSRMGAQ